MAVAEAGPATAVRRPGPLSRDLAAQAAALFTEELNSGKCPAAALASAAPVVLCHVYVDEDAVPCIQRGPSHLEAMLPPRLWRITARNMKLRVSLEVGAGAGPVCVHYTPSRRVPVSLRDSTGETIYSSMEITLALSPDTQTIPADLVAHLRGLYDGEGGADGEQGLPRAAVVAIFKREGLAHVSRVAETVSAAVPLAELDQAGSFSFEAFLAIVAMAPCTAELGGSAYAAPNVVQFLRVAFARKAPAAAAVVVDAAGTGMPHSGFLDVPFHAAFHNRAVAVKEGAWRRESIFHDLRVAREQLRAEQQEQLGDRCQPSLLPPFPRHLSVNRLFLPQLPDGIRDGSSPAEQELHAFSTFLLQESIKSQLVIRSTFARADQ